VGVDAWVTDEPQGRRARDFVKQLQRRSPDIRFTLGDPADETFRDKINPPGRLRAFVWLSGPFLNGTLLARGYADRQYPNPLHGDDPTEGGYSAIFDQARDRARNGGQGVWSTCPSRPSTTSAANTTGPALLASAVLPATTRARSAWATAPSRAIKRSPHARQPVGGLSGLVSVGPTQFLALTDNGFGKKANSHSFVLRIYRLGADFRTRDGGRRKLRVEGVVTLRDPHHRVPFRISTSGTTSRLLTGGDFDPESLVQGRRGELWIGDEFGPYILHVDKAGVLLEPPIPLPGVKSPDNVLPRFAKSPVTLDRSEGIEGLAMSPNGESLYAILEGPLRIDVDPLRRMVFEYDTVEGRFTSRRWHYRVGARGNSVSDLAAVDASHLLALEKTGANPAAPPFARVFEVDLQHADRQGYLEKQQVVDLLGIKDPHGISVTDSKAGRGAGTRYGVPAGVESVVKLGPQKIAVINDNNLTGGGAPGLGDDSDLAVIAVPQRFGA
jgi:glycerophosphoryl diester phosphodiesterase